MSKLKLLHGVSRVRRAKLQSSIDQTVANGIKLLAQWSINEMNNVINELLRLALAQVDDTLKYSDGERTSTRQRYQGNGSTDQSSSGLHTQTDPLSTNTVAHA